MAQMFGMSLPLVFIFWIIDAIFMKKRSVRTRIWFGILFQIVFVMAIVAAQGEVYGGLLLAWIGALLFAIILSIGLVIVRPGKSEAS
tara:strand:+ start:1156 stop:1416 length:261 start_codon:yes stop_codon:yes gene_type:complete